MSRPGKRVIYAIGALGLALATGALYRAGYLPGFPKEKSGTRDDARGEAPVSVTVAKAQTLDVPVSLDAVGTVQALNTVTIRPQVDGRLIRLAFNEGQDVRKDDVIAEIDPALYRAQHEQAVAKKAQDEANLANARIDLQRYQKLVAGKFLSQQQYSAQQALVQQLEAQVRSDQAAIDSARTTLDYATIRSPINGRAGIRLVDVGNLLRASDQTGIVVITQLKPIFVVFTLPQQALVTVQTAQTKGETKVLALGPDNASVVGQGRLADALALERAFISTIHAFGNRLLREYAFDAGASPDPRRLEDEEARVVVASCLAGIEAAKNQIGFYGSTPAYRPVLDLEGWGELGEELTRLSKSDGWAEMPALIDDEVLAAFTVIGTPEEAGTELRERYGDVATRVVLASGQVTAAQRERFASALNA